MLLLAALRLRLLYELVEAVALPKACSGLCIASAVMGCWVSAHDACRVCTDEVSSSFLLQVTCERLNMRPLTLLCMSLGMQCSARKPLTKVPQAVQGWIQTMGNMEMARDHQCSPLLQDVSGGNMSRSFCIAAQARGLCFVDGADCCVNRSRFRVALLNDTHGTTYGKLALPIERRDVVAMSLLTRGFWEIQTISQMVPNGRFPTLGTFLDVGANLGYYTILFASQHFDVVALEPMPQNVDAIRASLCINPRLQQRVKLVQTAMSAHSDQVCVLSSTFRNYGNGRLLCKRGSTKQRLCNSVRASSAQAIATCDAVNVQTLDSVLGELGYVHRRHNISVVKMDIEGAECDALAGGATFFSTQRPQYMQVEANMPSTNQCIRSFAQKLGYTVTKSKTTTGDTNLQLCSS